MCEACFACGAQTHIAEDAACQKIQIKRAANKGGQRFMIWLSVMAFLVTLMTGAAVLRWSQGCAATYGAQMPQRIHVGEVPRLGGIALLAGLLVSWGAGVVSSQMLGDPSFLRLGGWTLIRRDLLF